MKILLTNDDGIRAPGLWFAARALRQIGDVAIVAPERQQSGVGASLTLRTGLGVRPVPIDPELAGGEDADRSAAPPPGRLSITDGEAATEPGVRLGSITAHAVEGTPGDSCILALERVVGAVDLVVSGINAGSNLGWDVIVSGTVGAAIQGYIRGYPSIAISVGAVQNPRFAESAMLLQLIGRRLAQQYVDGGPALPNFLLNINVPSLPLTKIKGVQVTGLGNRSYGESVREVGKSPHKRYWIDRNRPISGDEPPGTDIWAIKNGHVSITPLHLSLGNQQQIPEIQEFFTDVPSLLLNRQD